MEARLSSGIEEKAPPTQQTAHSITTSIKENELASHISQKSDSSLSEKFEPYEDKRIKETAISSDVIEPDIEMIAEGSSLLADDNRLSAKELTDKNRSSERSVKEQNNCDKQCDNTAEATSDAAELNNSTVIIAELADSANFNKMDGVGELSSATAMTERTSYEMRAEASELNSDTAITELAVLARTGDVSKLNSDTTIAEHASCNKTDGVCELRSDTAITELADWTKMDDVSELSSDTTIAAHASCDKMDDVSELSLSSDTVITQPTSYNKTDDVSELHSDTAIAENTSYNTAGDAAGPQGDTDMETEQSNNQYEEYASTLHYNFDGSSSPGQMTGVWQEFQQKTGNFLKGCKWSPDGCCLLTNSDDNVLRIFNLPSELYTPGHRNALTEMSAVLCMCEGETVYDYCWYPYMTSLNPDTCCLLSTSRDHPVHMWDAFTGEVRCSYRSYNNMDEITSATSVAFNLDGSGVYCGFNKMVRVFDTNRPGRQYQERPTVVKKNGQSGLISCIAFSPDNSGLYALGSYSKSVGVYSESDGELLCQLQGQEGGVTHVLFSPDGTKLYSGGRKDDEILCWDVRNPGTVLYRLLRSVSTNQRIYFDLDRHGRYLVSGNADGTVTVWDTACQPVFEGNSSEATLPPLLSFAGHGDCVNGVSFHPSLPLLATASGQRKFPFPDVPDGDSDEETADRQTVDNSVRIWSLG